MDNESSHILAVVGKPGMGKRWLLKKVFNEKGIDAKWSGAGGMDIVAMYQHLYDFKDKVCVFYNILTLNKNEKDILLAIAKNKKIVCPSKNSEKYGVPPEFIFEGKLFIIADPYTKSWKGLEDSIDGYIYDGVSVGDFTKYIAENRQSICNANNIKESDMQRVVNLYQSAIEHGAVKKDDKLSGNGCTISSILPFVESLDEKLSHFMVPDEMSTFTEYYFEKVENKS